jgi:glycosyltransferase involved in cell wall biosynthesis
MNARQAPDKRPLVTIGMPVYNEERFLEHAVESLRNQDYQNIEILISDNASTDRTQQICSRIAREDKRVTYSRTERNIGSAANFRRVQAMAKGKYFMWAAGHDEWSGNLLSASVAILESTQSASIAFATSYWIDENGQRNKRETGYTDTRGMDAMARFFTVLWGNMHPVLGVIRVDDLRRTRSMQSFAGADLVLLAELVLMGDFVHASQAWWHRRDVRSQEDHRQRMQRYTGKEYGQSNSSFDRYFPLLRLPLGLINTVGTARIPWAQRLGLLFALLPSLPVRYIAGRRKSNRD